METNKPEKIAIVGAGLVGSLLAIYCAKRGIKTDVYEKRPDYRVEGAIGGRSINLALSDRGWKALEGVGIAEEIKKIAIPMYGRMMHDPKGNLHFQPYGRQGQAIYSVSRGELNTKLLSLADSHQEVDIFFDHVCKDVNLNEAQLTVENTDTGKVKQVFAEWIIGTDGAFSALRMAMQRNLRLNYSQQYIAHGYKELCIPANPDGTHKLEKNALHIWPRGSFMLIALPNLDGSFTCTLFLPFEGAQSFEHLQTEQQISDFFSEVFPDVMPLMDDLTKQFKENPTSNLVMVRSSPWSHQGRFLLMGDAAHAIVPFYGQGMNAGFEDCTVFNQLFDQFEHSKDLFKAFENLRIDDANAIADLALYNFIEMRDKVADERFLLRKKIEAHLHELYPDKWIPLYSMVTFSHIRYSDAQKIGKIQDLIMEKVLNLEGIADNWQTLDYTKIIDFEQVRV